MTCADGTFATIQDIRSILDPSSDLLDFTNGISAEFYLALDAGTTPSLPSGFEVPNLSPNCDQASQDILDDLVTMNNMLADCISNQNYLDTRLNDACIGCEPKFNNAIDINMIVLTAAELRITDQLDNLYLLKDPVVNGALQPIDDFSDETFADFQ